MPLLSVLVVVYATVKLVSVSASKDTLAWDASALLAQMTAVVMVLANT
jgi:hypothetical protein